MPEEAGVFTVYRLARGKVDLVYIGRSPVIQKSKLALYSLQKTLLDHETFFKNKFKPEAIDALDIYWYQTIESQHAELPGFVQGQLLQQYFEIEGSLPPWQGKW